MAVENTLAYYDMVTITAALSLIVHVQGDSMGPDYILQLFYYWKITKLLITQQPMEQHTLKM
jgi:hypothetical protein